VTQKLAIIYFSNRKTQTCCFQLSVLSIVEKQQSTMTSRKRASIDANNTSDFISKLKNDSINAAVELLHGLKANHNGRLPHNSMQKVISDLQTLGVLTDRDRLNYLLSKRAKRKHDTNTNYPPQHIQIATASTASTLTSDTPDGEEVPDDRTSVSFRSGRPSGTTIINQTEQSMKQCACLNDITTVYSNELKKSTSNKTKNNFLKNLIQQKWEEYDLGFESLVPQETIRTRCKRGNLVVERYGRRPVLPPSVESVIVDTVVAMSKIRHPLSVFEIVEFANSIIEKTEYQEQVIEWKKKMSPNLPNAAVEKLGYGWWRGFSKRYYHLMVVKRGEKFASDRSEWSKYSYISQMYDVIYRNMVDAGIAVNLEEELWMDPSGNVVANENRILNFEIDNNEPARPLGLPCNQKLIHPEFFLFFDETGCNTNQKKDGHYGGQKFACGRGMTPKQICATRDRHFTVLGLTAASGDSVLCVVIFASEKNNGVVANWAEGIDIMVDPVKDENGEIILSELNFGEGKYFPSGPTCLFRGKRIPYLPLSSPSGGITGELLVEILKWLDFNEVFERIPGGPEPFLLLDGHESRLSPVFVDYITDQNHIWHVNLGVPHATSYWQVGDASEQNGHFKGLLANAKKELVSFKIKHNIPIALNGEDIIPLINKAWKDSFANKVTNRKAIAARGWFPLNRNLLLHKEIKISENMTATEQIEQSENLPLLLNTTTGKSGDCFQKLLQHCLRHGGIERNQENLRNGESIHETFQKAKRISSSVMIRRSIHEVNNLDVVNMIQGNRDRIKDNEKKVLRKRRLEILNRIEVVTTLRLTKPEMKDWNAKECREYIQYKKRSGDQKMPTSLPLLQQRCAVIDGRSSPDCSVHESDDEDDAGNLMLFATTVNNNSEHVEI
jgi:hypothetical protein